MGTSLLVLVFMTSLFSIIDSAAVPIGEKTVYEEIVVRCPFVKNITHFEKQDVLNTCHNWTKIANTTLFEGTRQDVLCSNYFHSFVAFCTKWDPQLNHSDINLIPDLQGYDKKICPFNSSSKLDGMLGTLQNDTICGALCYYMNGSVSQLCQFTHYYLTKSVLLETSSGNNHQELNPNNTSLIPVKASLKPATNDPSVLGKGTSLLVVDSTSSVASQSKSTMKTEEPTKQSVKPITDVQDKTSSSDLHINIMSKPSDKPSVSPPTINNDSDKIPIEDVDNEIEESIKNEEDDDQDSIYGETKQIVANHETNKEKPETLDSQPVNYNNTEDVDGESYFFFYFMVVCLLFVLGYVGYHNRQKVLAFVLEGKRGKRQYRRRPNSANYHKLDSNLEEAMSSSCTKNPSHVIY